MFSLESSGSFSKTESFLKGLMRDEAVNRVLVHGGLRCVMALRLATPVDSGRTAASWDFSISKKRGVWILDITNSDIEEGFPVAIRLQYGYGTGSGGYVEGRDYINPAIQPILDQLAEEVWKAVTSG